MTQDNKLRKVVLIYIGIALFVGTIWFGATHSIVIVTKPKNAEKPESQIFESNTGNNMGGRFGVNIINRGSYSVEISSANKKSRKNINTKPFGIHKVSMTLNNQKQIRKVATDAENCLLGSPKGDINETVKTYSCANIDQVRNNNLTTSEINTAVGPYFNIGKPIPYNGGVVGVGFIENNAVSSAALSVIYSENDYQEIALPDITDSIKNNYSLASDGTQIAVADTASGKTYVIDSPQNLKSVRTTTIELPETSNIVLSSALFNKKLYLYSASTLSAREGELLTTGYITIHSLESGKTISTIKIDENTLNKELFEISIIDENTLVGTQNYGGGIATLYEINNNKLKKLDQIRLARDYIYANKSLYIVADDGGVYQYNRQAKQLSQIFGSENIKIRDIHYNGVVVSMNGTSTLASDQTQLTFIIDNADFTDKKRIEDSLPIGDEFNGISFNLIDYIGTTIVTQNPPLGYKDNSPAENQEMIKNLLKETGIDLSKYTVKQL